MNRAYSLLHIKAIDPDRRIIRGTATTPTPDRVGDVVEPLGATFPPELPLLLHHRKETPVGVARFAKPTRAGIEFEAELPIILEPGAVKDEVDRAWHSITHRLIRGVSIGFRVLDDAIELLKTGGMRFLKTEILELSLVTVPANQDATLAAVKSLDTEYLAAIGPHPARDVGTLPIVRARKDVPTMTTQEQITQWSNTRAPKAARMAELMKVAADTGVTFDEAQSEEFNTLKSEVKAIDAHLGNLKDMESLDLVTATPITKVADPVKAAELRAGTPVIAVKSQLPKGTAFVRWAMALAATRGNKMEAIEYAKRWHDTTPEVELLCKAAVAAGTTTDATWAGPLAVLRPLADEFLELLRPATLIGKIPGLRHVPFNVSVAAQTAGGTYGWVGQGAPKPVTNLAFGTVTLGMAKAAGIIVLTEELVKVSTPSAEAAVKADMIAGIAQFLDAQFVTPSVAEVPNVSPASITNGTTPLTTAGTSPDNARTDIKALIASFVGANLSTQNAVLLMSEANAFALGIALNPLGQPLYPGLGPNGGSIMGIPVITSQSVGNNVILVDANGILFADDGGVTLDVSREASLQMDSAPDNPILATTVMVSLWQANMVGLRAERWINWKRARLSSVKYVVATYV